MALAPPPYPTLPFLSLSLSVYLFLAFSLSLSLVLLLHAQTHSKKPTSLSALSLAVRFVYSLSLSVLPIYIGFSLLVSFLNLFFQKHFQECFCFRFVVGFQIAVVLSYSFYSVKKVFVNRPSKSLVHHYHLPVSFGHCFFRFFDSFKDVKSEPFFCSDRRLCSSSCTWFHWCDIYAYFVSALLTISLRCCCCFCCCFREQFGRVVVWVTRKRWRESWNSLCL